MDHLNFKGSILLISGMKSKWGSVEMISFMPLLIMVAEGERKENRAEKKG